MELDEAIRARRSVRAYSPDPVSRQDIEEIVALAGEAPSSFNAQPWHFHIAVGDARARAQAVLAQSTRYLGEYLATMPEDEAEMAEDFFAELGHAPAIIGVSIPDSESESDRINSLLSVGGAVQNFQLAATARGLASCTITFSYYVRDDLAKTLGVGPDRTIVTVVLVGVPTHEPESPGRKQDIFTWVE